MNYIIPLEEIDYKKKNSILFDNWEGVKEFERHTLAATKANIDYNHIILTGNFSKEDIGLAALSRGRVIDAAKFPK